jgi:hypothetical protein
MLLKVNTNALLRSSQTGIKTTLSRKHEAETTSLLSVKTFKVKIFASSLISIPIFRSCGLDKKKASISRSRPGGQSKEKLAFLMLTGQIARLLNVYPEPGKE